MEYWDGISPVTIIYFMPRKDYNCAAMPKGRLTYKEVAPQKRQSSKGMFDSIFGSPFMCGPFKKWSAHGLVPVVLGAAVVDLPPVFGPVIS